MITMTIKVRRYQIILFFCALTLVASVGTFSRETVRTQRAEITPQSSGQSLAVTGKVLDGQIQISVKSAFPRKETVRAAETKAVSSNLSPVAKNIALTFDDGPHPEYTERLLKVLRGAEVHATFFIVGKQVEHHPALLQKIVQEGHELANHTYNHRDMRSLSAQEIELELERTHKLVEAITEQKMKFFRPPGGRYNNAVIEQAKNVGYTMALWSVLPQDHARPSPQTIRKRVLDSVGNNGVILLHSGIENTLAALPDLISELRERGYTFVPLSQIQGDFVFPDSVKKNQARVIAAIP